MSKSEKLLARLTVPADADLVVPVRDFVNRVLARVGFSDEQLLRFDLIVEEACLHVVQNAFDADDDGQFDLRLVRRPNQIAIILEDRGLPGDLNAVATADDGGGEEQLGLLLMRAFADEVVFSNLGKGGRRIELIRELGGGPVDGQFGDAAPLAADPPVATDAVSLRLMTAADAPALARCIYRSYGYTYGNEFVYFPERVIELLAGGRLVSCVTVNEVGEVVGHLGLQFAAAGAKVAESGVAVVDPRYRGRKLFERMKSLMADWAGRNGVYGLCSEAVAVHPITQKGNLALGASETGVLLGYLPAGLEFRNITGGAAAGRQSAVMFYMKTNEPPARDIYTPPHHQEALQRIYDRIPVQRRCLPPPAAATLAAVGDQRSVLVLHVKPDTGRAYLKLSAFGGDALDLVHSRLRELRLRKVDCIFLDLPLAAPLTAVLCPAFEAMGFGFAGVNIEAADGDTLRLLYLNNVEVDGAGLVVVSDHGRKLADYVLAARATAEARR